MWHEMLRVTSWQCTKSLSFQYLVDPSFKYPKSHHSPKLDESCAEVLHKQRFEHVPLGEVGGQSRVVVNGQQVYRVFLQSAVRRVRTKIVCLLLFYVISVISWWWYGVWWWWYGVNEEEKAQAYIFTENFNLPHHVWEELAFNDALHDTAGKWISAQLNVIVVTRIHTPALRVTYPEL